MRRVLHIARREWLEQWRQPWMLAAIGSLDAIIAGLLLTSLFLLQQALTEPNAQEALVQLMPGATDSTEVVRALSQTALTVTNWLIFTQFLGIVAVLAGHAVLHDRQSGTLPFLLLAPVRRAELLLGKVLGAMGAPLALYLLCNGVAMSIAGSLEIASVAPFRVPPSPAFLVAFLLGGPLWALWIGLICAIVSSLSRDVRTAQQIVWFVVFFATFVCGILLSVLLDRGPGVQLGIAALGAAGAGFTLWIGTQVISRDLSR